MHSKRDVGSFSVAVIGAGPGGIATAIALQKKGFSFTVFEKSDGPGGTWRDNRYPGAACDVQSHLYSYSFNLKHDWSRIHAEQPEILEYLEQTVDKYGVRPRFRFNTGVEELRWDEEAQLWHLRTEGGEDFTFNAVISGVGLLNVPQRPSLSGMDDFKGKMIHTARWQDEDLGGKRVAVIGTGSSSGQVVKSIARHVGFLYVFQRQPGWVLPNEDRAVAPEEIAQFRRMPLRSRLRRWKIYWQRELAANVTRPGSKVHRQRTEAALSWLEKSVENPAVRASLTPDYPFNCKRPVRDPDFLQTFNRTNVELVPHAVTELTSDGMVAADGIERKVDVVILATGFKAADFLSTLRVYGKNNVELHDEWDKVGGAEAFLGVAVSGFPNFFMLYGPNSNSGTTSIIFVLECQVRYIVDALKRAVRGGWSSIEVTAAAQRRFNDWLQKTAPQTTWTSGCNNYFRAASGKLVTNWPHSSVLYWFMLRVFGPGSPFLFHKNRLGQQRAKSTRSSGKLSSEIRS